MKENQNKDNTQEPSATDEIIAHGKKHWRKYAIAVIFLLIDAYFLNYFIDEQKPTLANIVSLAVAIITLYFFHQRIEKQQRQLNQQREQIDIQIEQRIDDRFNAAVGLLGSSETSARTGAIYSLYQLAWEKDKYRRQIGQILCSHIRSKTQEGSKLQESGENQESSKTSEYGYQTEHKERPSNEIQTTIDLLFKKNGLYQQFEAGKDLECANLKHAYLVGANFIGAQCQGADFEEAQCQWANFTHAQCQGANFSNAQYQGANFSNAQYQGANFCESQCQGADFRHAKCQRANFWDAKCQGANFWDAKCQGAIFSVAECQGADFRHVKCQGADFTFAQCQGAHATDDHQSLKDRIGKDSQLENMVFAGEVDDETIQSIENAKKYISDDDYKRLQKIIKENKGKKLDRTLPDGIVTGVLEYSEEMQAIIERDWEKLEVIQEAENKNI